MVASVILRLLTALYVLVQLLFIFQCLQGDALILVLLLLLLLLLLSASKSWHEGH